MLKKKIRVLSSSETVRSAGGPSRPARVALLDEDALARLRELDPRGENQLMARVVQAFDTSVCRLVPELLASVPSELAADLAVVRRVGHTLKSSSASIGALELARLCAQLESMGQQGQREGIMVHVALFQEEVVAVQLALAQLVRPTP